MNEIYKNDVLVSDIPMEAFFFQLKTLIKMIENTMNVKIIKKF